MGIRPFFIKSHIQGRKTTLQGGPRNKDGGMITTVLQRNKGEIDTAFVIEQYSRINEDGKRELITKILDKNGIVIDKYTTEY